MTIMRKAYFITALVVIAPVIIVVILMFLIRPKAVSQELTCEEVTLRLAQLDQNSGEAIFLRGLNVCLNDAHQAGEVPLSQLHELGLSLSYPSEYERRQGNGVNSIVLTTSSDTRRLAIIRQEETDDINEYPAIRARRNKPDKYREETVEINNQAWLVFTNVDGLLEKTLFADLRGAVVSVALTAVVPTGNEQAQRDFETIRQSLRVDDRQ